AENHIGDLVSLFTACAFIPTPHMNATKLRGSCTKLSSGEKFSDRSNLLSLAVIFAFITFYREHSTLPGIERDSPQ
ncbi:MAG TPA: hypothetical protein VK177_14615, partial [Flavobacteriales bacterium]|nr:hypothetical protein [Flavobacteriales bacterium]